MKKIVRLTESDLTRLVKRIIRENEMESIKIGDMYKITNPNGSHLKFKITNKENNEEYSGTIIQVYGTIEPGDFSKTLKSPKAGDPIQISLDEDGSFYSFYLPKTYGEMEAGSGDISDLKKLN
jgi:hypothetical protein